MPNSSPEHGGVAAGKRPSDGGRSPHDGVSGGARVGSVGDSTGTAVSGAGEVSGPARRPADPALGFHPVVIIGAGRSGTNLLRDLLCALPGFATWPCDEINPIWRHGNAAHPSDELPPERATPRVCRYIRGRFRRLARRSGAAFVVEKTCANSLRVPFVAAVLPEARFVFIRRDGVDVVHSAMQRWTASFDLLYTLRKARFVPLSDLPRLGVQYVANRLRRLVSRQERLPSWGPRLEGMDELVAGHDLDEVCAIQWRRCVDRAEAALDRLPGERVHRLAYEGLVADAAGELASICRFLGAPASDVRIQEIVEVVSDRSVGKGRRELDEATIARIARWTTGAGSPP